MLVSVIVPVYNANTFLDRCINSILNQTYRKIELILVNDGSTDNSLEICKKYEKNDNRVVVINKKNEGVSATRNAGLKKATGDYITFVDADDYIEKNFIEYGIEKIKKNDVDMIKFNYIKESRFVKLKNKIKISTNEIIKVNNPEIKDKIFKTDNFCPCWGNIYKASIAKQIEFNTNMRVGEDFLYVAKYLTYSKNVLVLDEYMYHYVINPNSTTHDYNINKSIEKSAEAIKANIEIENLLFKKEEILDKTPRLVKSKKNVIAFICACIENNNYKKYKDTIKKYKENEIIKRELVLLEKIFTYKDKKLLECNKRTFLMYKLKLNLKRFVRKFL